MAKSRRDPVSGKQDLKNKLGKRKAHYPVNNRGSRHWLPLIGGIILLLSTLVTLAIYGTATWASIEQHGRAVLINRMPLLLLLLLVLLPLSIILIFVAGLHWQDGITLFESGFIRRKGNRLQIWLWSETQRMDTRVTLVKFGGGIVNAQVNLLLQDKTGRKITIKNHYDRMEELINNTRQKILPILYEDACRHFIKGQKVIFNQALLAEKNGLHINDRFMTWDKIDKPVVKNKSLILEHSSKQIILLKANLKEITNLDLLVHLVENPPEFN